MLHMTQLPKIKRKYPQPKKSFLLLGPRGTGKSTWLASVLPTALTIDLLNSARFLQLSQNPSILGDLVSSLKQGDWVIIDEVQRIPELLNEVHHLYESKGLNFALSGSSARKLRRNGANLLAGRALQLFMFPFVFPEYCEHWSVQNACEWGTLPLVVSDPEHKKQILATYVDTYIKEEITAEALVRKLDPFVRVLQVAGLYNSQIMNIENLARESGVKRTTVERYLDILEDTLLANRVPAIHLGIRTKETKHPKFFMFDSGIARAAAGLIFEEPDSVWKGFAFECLIYQETRAYNSIAERNRPIFHFSVSGGFDVDLIIQTASKTLSTPQKFIAIEVKSGKKFRHEWLNGLRVLQQECKKSFVRGLVVYQGTDRLVMEGLDVIPVDVFLQDLHEGRIF